MLPDTTRRLLRVVLPLIAVAIIVAGLWPQPGSSPTDAERVHSLASNIRCPFCGGEPIADAPSQIARDLEVIIAEQVAAGASDQEVYDFFEARYGESALMSPPLTGWGWVLWAGPLVVLIAGGYAIARRRRSTVTGGAAAPPRLERTRIVYQLEQIERDLTELDEQVAAGELDDSTRFDLAAAYESEASPLRARLAEVDRGQGDAAASPLGDDLATAAGPVPTADRRRAFAGAAVLLAGVAVVSLMVIRMADDGTPAIDVPTAPPIDLDDVTLDELENVVARNPDIIGMRLALAQLYMQEGDVQSAVVHFGEVLERERNPEALAWLGYISFQVGELDAARNYLDEALEIQPGYPQAEWWLANLLFYGFQTPADAVPHLEAVLAGADVPDEIRVDAQSMLAEAGGTG